MEEYKVKIIETIIVLVSYFLIRTYISRSLDRVARKLDFKSARGKIVKKLINTALFILGIGLLLFIWGVDQNELLFFISSLLTIIGIAFFAQWSILSNITSALIIFFNHPAQIGDVISILDKDFQIEGKISDIGIFFITLKTESGHAITVPNNLFMQKMIERKPNNP